MVINIHISHFKVKSNKLNYHIKLPKNGPPTILTCRKTIHQHKAKSGPTQIEPPIPIPVPPIPMQTATQTPMQMANESVVVSVSRRRRAKVAVSEGKGKNNTAQHGKTQNKAGKSGENPGALHFFLFQQNAFL